jgi:hypothetical protein
MRHCRSGNLEKKGGRLMNKRPQVKGGNAQGGHGDNNVVALQ